MAHRIAAILIDGYRRWISPFFPPACRFYPSCSSYAREAYLRHGFFAGSALAAWRILRCHPYHPGGFDPVPDRFTWGFGRRARRQDD